MNDEFGQLEDLLGVMPLRKPPSTLDGKVLPPRRRVVPWVVVVGAAAAAAIVAIVVLRPPPATRSDGSLAGGKPADIPRHVAPLRLEETISSVRYQGLVVQDAKTPLRVFRRRTIERAYVLDEETGYAVETSEPRERVVLVNAEMY